jgi:PAS domain S-box-containing protein
MSKPVKGGRRNVPRLRKPRKVKVPESAPDESVAWFTAIFENAMDGIVIANADDYSLRSGNAAFCRMFGYEPEEVGRLRVMDLHPEKDLAYVMAQFDKHAEGASENLPVKRKDGSVFYADITVAPFEAAGVRYLAGFFRDITERKAAEDELQRIATTDSLTGVANRREFARLLKKEMGRARRYGVSLSIIMYDLDHFKRVNDEYGHDVGDSVLRATCRLVTGHLRVTDLVARWGGEEFLVLTPDTDIAAAKKVAENPRCPCPTAKMCSRFFAGRTAWKRTTEHSGRRPAGC